MTDSNKGVVDQVSDALSNAAQGASDTLKQGANYLTGQSEEAQRKAAGEAVTSEHTSAGQKLDAAKSYVSHGTSEAEAKGKKEFYENK